MTGSLNSLASRTPRALALAGLLLLLAGCGLNDVRVTVTNASRQPLDSLFVVGEARAWRVRALAPGRRVRLRLGVTGEDALALHGRIGGRPLVPQMAVYVEDGSRLRLVVDAGGVVHVDPRDGD